MKKRILSIHCSCSKGALVLVLIIQQSQIGKLIVSKNIIVGENYEHFMVN